MIHRFVLWLITIKLWTNLWNQGCWEKCCALQCMFGTNVILTTVFCDLYCRRRLFPSKHMGDTSCRSAGVIMTEMMPSVVWTFGWKCQVCNVLLTHECVCVYVRGALLCSHCLLCSGLQPGTMNSCSLWRRRSAPVGVRFSPQTCPVINCGRVYDNVPLLEGHLKRYLARAAKLLRFLLFTVQLK